MTFVEPGPKAQALYSLISMMNFFVRLLETLSHITEDSRLTRKWAAVRRERHDGPHSKFTPARATQ